jgi:hypothetical protein
VAQSWEEMLVTLMQVMGRDPTDELASTEELRKAKRRVGETRETRLKWALKFANTKLSEMTPGDWFNTQLELSAFRTPVISSLQTKTQVPVTDKAGFFPNPKQIKEIHEQFNRLLANYSKTRSMTHPFEGRVSFSVAEGAEGKTAFSFVVNDYVADCLIKLMQLTGDFADLVRICPKEKHGCGEWFLASRSDKIFCTTTCVSNSTSHARRARLKAKNVAKRRTA